MASEEPPREGEPKEPTRRLFFALWPDEAMRQAMVQATRKAARASGGRPVPVGNLHVTLAFLGSVPERRLPELAKIARASVPLPALAAVNAPGSARSFAADRAELMGDRLAITFDRLEHWRPAQLLCVLPAEPPAPMAALARSLQEQLAAGGFAPDLKPFRPHVTVVRKVSRPGRIDGMHPVVWSFTELALIESRTLPEGASYSVVEALPLCGGRQNRLERF